MLKTKKYAIAGTGLEGKAAWRYFSKFGQCRFFDDNNPKYPNINQIPNEFTVIRSPGINPNKFAKNLKIWSSTNEFFAKCPAKIIGVTGTKGKGTVSSMIYSILNEAIKLENSSNQTKKTVHLVGNIGTPALDILDKIKPNDIVIFELSSFQLWDCKYSPNIAVLLPIEPDHLDVHKDFSEYYKAKMNITKTAKSVIKYPAENISFNTKILNIPGPHNIENAKVAILACQTYNKTISTKIAELGLKNFKGLDHRLKFVDQINNISYYDDSISTTVGSVIAAINSFQNPKIILLGGYDKGADYSVLPQYFKNNVKAILLYGANSDKILHQIKNNTKRISTKIINTKIQNNKDEKAMQKLVAQATKFAKVGDSIILSPAAASFDMFDNYKDRGEQFINAVRTLHKTKIGVFDSGKGGQFVTDKLKFYRPNDKFTTINDSKNIPYGSKSPSEIIDLTLKKIKTILNNDIIIIACNTATAYAIDTLRELYQDKKFIGFEPMFKPAAEQTNTNSICVLATPATLKSSRYKKLKRKYAANIDVYEPDCSSWAEEIENNNFNVAHLQNLKKIIASKDVDIIVLACTHYIDIKKKISQIIGDSITILEPTKSINRRINSLI